MSNWERFIRWLITLRRIVRSGCINFVRNSWLSIAAMAVMLITLTIVLFSVIANATFNQTVEQITNKINVSVYLKDSVNEARTNELIEQIKQLENVDSVNYVTKEQALIEYKKQNADNIDLILAVSATENPLPATIQIKPSDPSIIDPIKEFLETPDIKQLQSNETSYSGDRKEAVDKIAGAATFLRRAGVAGVIIFALISMMIIFNTIQMAIFNRRDEITIMRLLGATTSYIRGPFVVESMLYGVISAFISVALLNALFTVSSSTLQASSLGLLDINYANEYFAKHFWLFLTLQIVVGIFIGAASSIVATRRYLKFKSAK